jgi:hypothetical protein
MGHSLGGGVNDGTDVAAILFKESSVFNLIRKANKEELVLTINT